MPKHPRDPSLPVDSPQTKKHHTASDAPTSEEALPLLLLVSEDRLPYNVDATNSRIHDDMRSHNLKEPSLYIPIVLRVLERHCDFVLRSDYSTMSLLSEDAHVLEEVFQMVKRAYDKGDYRDLMRLGAL